MIQHVCNSFIFAKLNHGLPDRLSNNLGTSVWAASTTHPCRELRATYAGICAHALAAAPPAVAEAAAVNFITLEARLGDAPAPVPAASLTGQQYAVVRALRWRRRQLLGLLAAGEPYPVTSSEASPKQPAALSATTPGRASTRTPGGPTTGETPATSACMAGHKPTAREGLGPEGARALLWVDASDLAAHCTSVLLHQVTNP